MRSEDLLPGHAGSDPRAADPVASDPATRGFDAFQRCGDRSALADALLTCAPELMLRLRQLRVPLQDQPDLVQECFAVAIRRSDEFDPSRRLMAWLLGILANLVRSHRRHQGSMATRFEALTDQDTAVAGIDPADRLNLTSWRQRVQGTLATMPDRYRTVLQEHLLIGRTPTEIAAGLQRPPSTVRTQLERGLRELRQRLPAPLLLGLLAVEAAAQATPGGPPAGAVPTTPRLPVLRWAALPVLLVAVAAWVQWWPGAGPAAPSERSTTTPAGPLARTADGDAPPERAAVPAPTPPASHGEVRLRLLHPSGAPAAGVAVLIEAPTRPGEPLVRSQFRWRPGVTDAHGVVAFPELPPGPAAVRLHDEAAEREFRVEPGLQELSLQIRTTDRIRVRVVDAGEQPVPDAEVWVSGNTGRRSPGYVASRTDRNGDADIDVFLSTFYLWARAPGRVVGDLVGPIAAGRSRAHTLRLLTPAAACDLRVLDHQGRPVAGALVSAWSERTREKPARFGRTDPAGQLRFADLPPGPVRVGVVAAGVGVADAVVEALAGSQGSAGTTELRLRPGGTVRGRILGLPADQVAATRIISRRASALAIIDPFASHGAAPAADGSFLLPDLAPGRHDVALFKLGESAPRQVRQVEIHEAAATDLQFVVQQDRPVWNIRVVDGADRPLAGGWLRTVSPLRWVHHRHSVLTRIDANGLAAVPWVGDTPQIVTIHLARPAPAGQPGGKPIMDPLPVLETTPMLLADTTIVVPGAGLQRARVRGRIPASYRDPARLQRLSLLSSPLCGRPIVMAADGGFDEADLPPGRYLLRLENGDQATRYSQYLARFDLAPGQILDLGELTDPGQGTLELTLSHAAAAAPVPFELRDGAGNFVTLRPAEPGRPIEYWLAAGEYRMQFATSTGAWREQRVAIQAGRTARVALDRRAGRWCRIRVESAVPGPTMPPLLGRLQRVGSAHSCQILLAPKVSGTAWTGDLDLAPGHYRLELEAAWGQRVATDLDVRPGAGRCDFPLQLR